MKFAVCLDAVLPGFNPKYLLAVLALFASLWLATPSIEAFAQENKGDRVFRVPPGARLRATLQDVTVEAAVSDEAARGDLSHLYFERKGLDGEWVNMRALGSDSVLGPALIDGDILRIVAEYSPIYPPSFVSREVRLQWGLGLFTELPAPNKQEIVVTIRQSLTNPLKFISGDIQIVTVKRPKAEPR